VEVKRNESAMKVIALSMRLICAGPAPRWRKSGASKKQVGSKRLRFQ